MVFPESSLEQPVSVALIRDFYQVWDHFLAVYHTSFMVCGHHFGTFLDSPVVLSVYMLWHIWHIDNTAAQCHLSLNNFNDSDFGFSVDLLIPGLI